MKPLVACALAAALAIGLARWAAQRDAGAPRLVVIAIDGLDAQLVSTGIAARRLPAFADLSKQGARYTLTSAASTQTHSAWVTLATGLNPGQHGVYDVVTRDPRTYQLDPNRGSATIRTLEELAFWTIARHAGVRCRCTMVPVVFNHAWRDNPAVAVHYTLSEADQAFDADAARLLDAIEADDWELLVGAIRGLDPVQHLAWRETDAGGRRADDGNRGRHVAAVNRMYQRVDRLVGEVLGRIDARTSVMVLSAYGFQPVRAVVNLNTWLVERGYMQLRRPVPQPKTMNALADGGPYFDQVDWSRTRAYALGFGQIFVNLRGREGLGTVAPGAEYEALLDALIIDLMNFLDPRSEQRVVATVHKRDEIFRGPLIGTAPDLLVALEPDYRVSWPSALGATPPRSVEANATRWSGDHQSMHVSRAAGVLLTNRPLTSAPRVIDVAPSILGFFGLHTPTGMEGRPLFPLPSSGGTLPVDGANGPRGGVSGGARLDRRRCPAVRPAAGGS